LLALTKAAGCRPQALQLFVKRLTFLVESGSLRLRHIISAQLEELFEGVRELSFSAMFRERMRNMPEEIRERRFRNIGDPRRRDRFMSTYELGVRSPYVKHGIAAYERAFKLLEDTLTETGPWILGANPSLADIYLMPSRRAWTIWVFLISGSKISRM
jgi:glutathione S-transferase